jgi:ABC-type molybdate transport system substrate-binding protein
VSPATTVARRFRGNLAALLAIAAVPGIFAAIDAAHAQTEPPVAVYAAGSLREAMTAIAGDWEARTGRRVALTFGASGLLRERIERGEAADVFASADIDHPDRLAKAGAWRPPVVFARNVLCALTAPALTITPAGLLDTMLRPDVRLGTSTPKADPSGDYAWALFRRADSVRPGAFATLEAKALKLTGGPDSPRPPPGVGTYAWVMDQGQADVFLTYCTNAVAAQREMPRLGIVAVPPELQVGAAYGLTVRRDAPASAAQFVELLLSPEGQSTLARFGFGKP